MTLASGLGSQLGLARETTFGTAVTPTKFYEFDSAGLNMTQNFNDSIGLRANRMFQPSGRMIKTTRSAGGDTPMQVPTKLFGTILDALNGITNTPVQQAATTAYLNTFNVGTSQPNKSFTLQVNKPDINGNDHAFTYPGSVLTSIVFSCDAGGVLTCTPTWWTQDETTPSTTPAGAALASASYATGVTAWQGVGSGVSVSVNGSPLTVANSWSLTWTQPYRTDQAHLGSGGLFAKPIPNGLPTLTGTVSVDWATETEYLLYRNGTIIDVYADFQGNTIASTYKEEFKADCTAAQIRDAGPVVGGPDVLTQDLNFTAGDNGTNVPLIVSYQSTDTAI
jgi:hypothetical protein